MFRGSRGGIGIAISVNYIRIVLDPLRTNVFSPVLNSNPWIAISVNYIIILISPEPLPIALLNKLETNIFSADKIDL